MNSFGRCIFAAALAVTLTAGAADVGTGKAFKGPLGLQMYSLRFYSPSNALAKLDKTRELGFRTIEGGAGGSRLGGSR